MAGEDKAKAVQKLMSPQDNAKAQALKEARFLFDKLESGNITPYATPQDMGNDIRSKVRISGEELAVLIGKTPQEEKLKERNDVALTRIKDAVGRVQIRANPLSEEGILIPYISSSPPPVSTSSPNATSDIEQVLRNTKQNNLILPERVAQWLIFQASKWSIAITSSTVHDVDENLASLCDNLPEAGIPKDKVFFKTECKAVEDAKKARGR